VSLSTSDDEKPLEEDSPPRLPRYADDPPRPVRERMYSGQPRHRPDRQLSWGPLLAAAAAGFLISVMVGPCGRTDPRREQELASVQSDLQGARDRIAELESQLPTAREGVPEAAAAEQPRASEPEPQAPPPPEARSEPKPEARSEPPPEPRREEPIARAEAAKESPPPQPEAERVALAEQHDAVSVYEVPDPHAPIVRSTPRSSAGGVAPMQVLAPERAGWTTEAKPTLYWHASKGMPSAGQFTLIREGQDEPLVRGRLTAPDGPGIQRIELSQSDVSLEVGASYRWTISFADPAHSGSELAIGGIRRVAPPETLRAVAGPASVTERLDALERAGLWYDALDLVTRTIEDNSGAKNLVARRDAMLARVGLHLPSS
jgi:outer membrane biosynthesis protein TonB